MGAQAQQQNFEILLFSLLMVCRVPYAATHGKHTAIFLFSSNLERILKCLLFSLFMVCRVPHAATHDHYLILVHVFIVQIQFITIKNGIMVVNSLKLSNGYKKKLPKINVN